MDSALNNSFKSLLASGRSLKIAVQSVFTQAHLLPANSNSAQISMVLALSKLGLAFLSFNTTLATSTAHEFTGFGNLRVSGLEGLGSPIISGVGSV